MKRRESISVFNASVVVQRSQNFFRTVNAHDEGAQDAENIQARSSLLLIPRSGYRLRHHLQCRRLLVPKIFNELSHSLSRNILAVEKS